jgi:hypothetical protein
MIVTHTSTTRRAPRRPRSFGLAQDNSAILDAATATGIPASLLAAQALQGPGGNPGYSGGMVTLPTPETWSEALSQLSTLGWIELAEIVLIIVLLPFVR